MRAITTHACIALCVLLGGCSVPYHVSVGDIDARNMDQMKRFEIELLSGGLDEEAVVSYFSDTASSFLSWFSMGPRTGRAIRKPSIGGSLIEEIYKKCPSGQITGLLTVRESKTYYFYSKEIVRISGYCILED